MSSLCPIAQCNTFKFFDVLNINLNKVINSIKSPDYRDTEGLSSKNLTSGYKQMGNITQFKGYRLGYNAKKYLNYERPVL
jgi:hypothetical protein